ncbi:DUF1059 domain-containing protein [Gordonia aichiensis]
MKEFWCGAVIPDCDARFLAASESELLDQVAAHAASEHGVSPVPPETVARVRELITDRSGE